MLLANICYMLVRMVYHIVLVPDSGEAESGTVAYTAICSLQDFSGMNLIGWVLLNCIVALHRWLSMEKCSDSISDSIIPLFTQLKSTITACPKRICCQF